MTGRGRCLAGRNAREVSFGPEDADLPVWESAACRAELAFAVGAGQR